MRLVAVLEAIDRVADRVVAIKVFAFAGPSLLVRRRPLKNARRDQ